MRYRSVEATDAWEGSGAGEHFYDEKADKRYQSTIWKYLLALGGFMLVFVLFNHVKEWNVILNGTAVEAVYYVDDSGRHLSRFYDEDGKVHTIQIDEDRAVHKEDTITMYYLDSPYDAIYKSNWTSWAWYYAVFGSIFAVSLWRLLVIYRH